MGGPGIGPLLRLAVAIVLAVGPAGAAAGAARAVGSPADLVSSDGFDGLANSVNCAAGRCFEPPDPTVAVNEGWIVQAVNEQLRITSRSGVQAPSTVSLPSFFGISGRVGESDPRIAWDTLHGRWILSYMSWDCTAGDLRLAVSDGADPTAGWQRLDFSSPGLIPDFPAIGTSADKIVLAANYFAIDPARPGCFSASYRGTRMVAWDWADLIDGAGATALATPLNTARLNYRPALGIGLTSADTTVHALVQTGGGAIEYVAVTGSAVAGTLTISRPIATAFPALSQSPPIVHPGAVPGISALDERITDTLWQADRLWFVATSGCTSGAAAACVRVGTLSTLDRSVIQDVSLGGDGVDTYVGGIGLALDGTAYVVATRSTASTAMATVATFQSAADAPGAFHPLSVVRSGAGDYDGTRWGDYAMVAADPLDPHAVWQADAIPDAAATWTTWVSKLSGTPGPPLAGPPSPSFRVPATLAGSVPVGLTWSRPIDPTAVVGWQLQERQAGAGWTTVVAGTTALSAVRSLTPGATYEYQVAATDPGGTTGPFSASTVVRPLLAQESTATAAYAGSWYAAASASASGGATKYATRAGAQVSYWFAGRAVAWVAPKGWARGSARVYVDGVYAGTVSLYSRTGLSRQLVFARSWSISGSHSLTIVVAGTAGHPRVDVDGFVILR